MPYLISVIIPIYNSNKYLNKCITSVMNQSYKNLEIILVDDGSTDNSFSICEDLSKKDCRIKLIKKQNGGAASARNAGLDMATGEFIGFVDSDDYLEPTMYQELIMALYKYDCSVSKCLLRPIPCMKKEILFSEDKRLFLLSMGEVSVCNSLFRREKIMTLKFKEGVSYEDTLFMFSVLKCINNVAIVNKKLYNYCSHDNTTTSSPLKKKDLNKIEIYEEIESYFTDNCCNEKNVIKYLNNAKHTSLFDLVVKIANYGYDDTLSFYEIRSLVNKLSDLYKTNKIDILLNITLSWKKKSQIMLFALNPNLYIKIKKKYTIIRRGKNENEYHR